MANKVEWELDIIPINISTYEASINATRIETDEADPQNPIIVSEDTYTVPRARIETQAEQIAVAQEVLSKRQKEKDDATVVQNFVSAAETAGKQYLEANDNG